MQGMDMLALAITLGFAAGLNVYLVALLLGLGGHQHWLMLPGTLTVLANPWVIGVCGFLYAAHFVADKIPVLDVAVNVAHTFVRLPLAGLMGYAASSGLGGSSPFVMAAASMAAAGVAHSGKTAARLLVTPSPEPVSNTALSSGEDVLAAGLLWLVFHHPLVGGAAVGVLLLGVLAGLAAGAVALRRLWQAWVTGLRRSDLRGRLTARV